MLQQGKDFVYVKLSLALFGELTDWTEPVQLRLEEGIGGDILLVTRRYEGER